MPISSSVLARNNWRAVSSQRFEVAVLPWGATEAHNYHLPYGTDTIQASRIAQAAAEAARLGGARVMVLPAIPYGVQSGQLDIPFCMHVNPATQAALLRDIVGSLERHGVRKLVLVNGHGGNDFKSIIREIQPLTSVFLCTMDWYRSVSPSGYFDEPGDHAGELETSVMMHLAPDLVLPLSEAGDGAAREFTVTALREGWAWSPRKWTQVSLDTGVGDPRAASAEKGSAYVAAVVQRIASFLVELSAMDPDAAYGSAPPEA